MKFHHQHPLDPYAIDFYCVERKLAVEVDGGQRGEPEAKAQDARRTAFLQTRGIRVLRFWNSEVLSETEAVVEEMHRSIEEQPPSSPVTRPAA